MKPNKTSELYWWIRGYTNWLVKLRLRVLNVESMKVICHLKCIAEMSADVSGGASIRVMVPEQSSLDSLTSENQNFYPKNKVRSVRHVLPQFREPRKRHTLNPRCLWVTYQRLIVGPRSKGHLWNMMWKTKENVRAGIVKYENKERTGLVSLEIYAFVHPHIIFLSICSTLPKAKLSLN